MKYLRNLSGIVLVVITLVFLYLLFSAMFFSNNSDLSLGSLKFLGIFFCLDFIVFLSSGMLYEIEKGRDFLELQLDFMEKVKILLPSIIIGIVALAISGGAITTKGFLALLFMIPLVLISFLIVALVERLKK